MTIEYESKTELKEIVESVKLVYLGKKKIEKTVKRGWKDSFWRASFKIGPDFKGSSEQKAKICHALVEIFAGHDMLTIDYVGEFAQGVLCIDSRIVEERTDDGSYIDERAKIDLEVLNSPEAKKAIEAYLVFVDAKQAVKKVCC